MRTIIDLVARRAGITAEQAELAVAAMLRFLSGRLPSPVFGQIRALLDESEAQSPLPPPCPTASDLD